MHIISEKKLREFWTNHPEAESPLRAWLKVVEQADRQNFAEVRATFAHADAVGRCIVFNIGGNKFRLIAAIHYNRGKDFVRYVLTHAEYDQGHWKADCSQE
jgi:mRNA interferase HigB